MSPSTQTAMDMRYTSQSISEHGITARLQDWNRTGTRTVANYKKPKATLITFWVSRYQARTLGERIRKKRLVMGLKQVALASLLGVHEMTIRELGDRENKTIRPEARSGQRVPAREAAGGPIQDQPGGARPRDGYSRRTLRLSKCISMLVTGSTGKRALRAYVCPEESNRRSCRFHYKG